MVCSDSVTEKTKQRDYSCILLSILANSVFIIPSLTVQERNLCASTCVWFVDTVNSSYPIDYGKKLSPAFSPIVKRWSGRTKIYYDPLLDQRSQIIYALNEAIKIF